MKCENFILAAEILCEWKFATKFASDCECEGMAHSALLHYIIYEHSVLTKFGLL